MHSKYRTIYKVARLYAGYTQESAAELINVSVESMRAYERGVTVPPSVIVVRMIEVYNTPWLAYQHLKMSDPVGQRYLPDIDFRDLPTSVLQLQKEMADTNSVSRDMIEITCDGRVDKHEESGWNKVHKELRDLIGAALAVIFAPLQKEKPPALARKTVM